MARLRWSPTSRDAAALTDWGLMAAAMMLPVAVPAARHVAQNSLRRRRRRAVAELLAGYLAIWIAFGPLALAAISATSRFVAPAFVLAGTLVLAAGWQMSPWIKTFRRRCHRTVPLPPTGLPADVGAVRFGLRHGAACAGVCWPLMLVAAVLLHAGIVWMVVLAALIAGQRLVPRLAGARSGRGRASAGHGGRPPVSDSRRTVAAASPPHAGTSWFCALDR